MRGAVHAISRQDARPRGICPSLLSLLSPSTRRDKTQARDATLSSPRRQGKAALIKRAGPFACWLAGSFARSHCCDSHPAVLPFSLHAIWSGSRRPLCCGLRLGLLPSLLPSTHAPAAAAAPLPARGHSQPPPQPTPTRCCCRRRLAPHL